MKDLTAFKIAFRQLVKSGYTIETAFKSAVEAQGLFDNYIAEQAEASKLKPVDAETAMQNITEAISLNPEQEQLQPKCGGNCGMNYCDDNGCIERKRNLVQDVPCKPEQPQKFYWKPVEQFTEEDAVKDANGCIMALDKIGQNIAGYLKPDEDWFDKYLAHCKEDKGEFVPCWEWDGMYSKNDIVEISEDGKGFWFTVLNIDEVSAYYPTLEAAKYEAERYYNLYVKK